MIYSKLRVDIAISIDGYSLLYHAYGSLQAIKFEKTRTQTFKNSGIFLQKKFKWPSCKQAVWSSAVYNAVVSEQEG